MSIRTLSRFAARRWILPVEAAAAASSAGIPAANSSALNFYLAPSRPAAAKGALSLHTRVFAHGFFSPRCIPTTLIALAAVASFSLYLNHRDKRDHEEEEASDASTDDETREFNEESYRWDKWEAFRTNKDDLPEYVNWVEAGAVNSAKDQDATDSCAQCAAVATVEGLHFLKTGKLVKLSVQQLVDCMGYGHRGGTPVPASFRYMAREGCALEVDYPFMGISGPCQTGNIPVAVRIDGYFMVEATEENLMRAVSMQPVAVDVYANQAFLEFEGGRTLELSDCEVDEVPDKLQAHTVLCVGYGKDEDGKYWLIQSSWGEGWGDNGFAKLRRGVADSRGRGVAGITFPAGEMSGCIMCSIPVID